MNNRTNKILACSLILGGIFLLAGAALAADKGYTLEFEIPSVPKTTDLPGYLRGIFIFGLSIVGITAMASIMIGGIRYMASDLVTTKQDAKDQIRSAIYGLLLLLFSYLILNTINPELVSLTPPHVSPVTGQSEKPSSGTKNADQAVRDQIAQATNGKVTVNKSCTNPQVCASETCLGGLQQSTTDGVAGVQQSCNCSFVITGGTEPCHASGAYSHLNGYKLDLRPNSNLDSYVQQQGCPKTPNKNCAGSDGNVYRYETDGGAHWDVCFKCPSASSYHLNYA